MTFLILMVLIALGFGGYVLYRILRGVPHEIEFCEFVIRVNWNDICVYPWFNRRWNRFEIFSPKSEDPAYRFFWRMPERKWVAALVRVSEVVERYGQFYPLGTRTTIRGAFYKVKVNNRWEVFFRSEEPMTEYSCDSISIKESRRKAIFSIVGYEE